MLLSAYDSVVMWAARALRLRLAIILLRLLLLYCYRSPYSSIPLIESGNTGPAQVDVGIRWSAWLGAADLSGMSISVESL